MADLVSRQLPAVNVKVALNASLVDGLGNDTPALLNAPDEHYLLDSLALLLSQFQESGVLVKRRVGGSQARVSGAVNALGGAVGNQLGRGVVGVQLNLVNGRNDLAARVIQELLEVLDAEVGDTNVLNLASGRELLEFLPAEMLAWVPTVGEIKRSLPSLNEVPVRQVLLCVVRVGRAGPVHQVEIDVIQAKALEGRVNALSNAMVPGVVQLSGNPDLTTGNTRVPDTVTDLSFIAIGKSTAGLSIHS